MNSMIQNFLNGNLTDAKRQAKRKSYGSILAYLRFDLGWTDARSKAVAAYLKGKGTFQAACDADEPEKSPFKQSKL